IQQTWFGLDAERRDLITDKAICSGSLGPGSVFGGVITSGVVRVSSKIWPWVSDGLGCPPKSGLKVVACLRLDLMTGSGHFASPSRGFAFNWIYPRSEEHTSELQSRFDLVCRLLLEKKKKNHNICKHVNITTVRCHK